MFDFGSDPALLDKHPWAQDSLRIIVDELAKSLAHASQPDDLESW